MCDIKLNIKSCRHLMIVDFVLRKIGIMSLRVVFEICFKMDDDFILFFLSFVNVFKMILMNKSKFLSKFQNH